MPIAIDPQQTFSVTLENDTVSFVFRYMTGRQWLQAQKRYSQVLTSDDAETGMTGLKEILAITMQSWTLPDVSFDVSEIDNYLTVAEMRLLVEQMLRSNTITPTEKKKLESLSATVSADSASVAEKI